MTTLSEFIDQEIREWVKTTYSNAEVKEPSWTIEELASYLARKIESRELDRDNLSPYELTVIVPEEINADMAIAKIEKQVEHIGGRLVSKENEGAKRLAYSINNHDRGIFIYFDIGLPDGAPAKLSSWMNINDDVLRYLLVKEDTMRR